MKKLFVLFLLVALVPFTVGCSLFGSNYDDPETPPTFKTATAKAVIPAALAANIRAVAINEGDLFYGWKIIKNGITLTAYDATDNGNNTYTVLFKNDTLTQAQADLANAQVFTVKITNATNVEKVAETVVNTELTGEVTLTITGNTVTGVQVGTTAIPTTNFGEKMAMTVRYGTSVMSSTAVNVTTLLPTFEIELDQDIVITDGNLPENTALTVTLKNAAGTEVTAAITDFEIAAVNGSTKKFTVTVKDQAEPKKLNNGQTYTVTINNFKLANGKTAASASYSFKVVLPVQP